MKYYSTRTHNMRLFLLLTYFLHVSHAQELQSLDSIINQFQKLENKRDPKCYATATRLENLMYGTPLDDKARFEKNLLQKKWILELWTKASMLAQKDKAQKISALHVRWMQEKIFKVKSLNDKEWSLQFHDQNITINKTDKRQYSTVAYGLRAIMAVQQDVMLDPQYRLLPLSEEAVDTLKDGLDFYTLAALQSADKSARLENRYSINTPDVQSAWNQLQANKQKVASQRIKEKPLTQKAPTINNLTVLKSIIKQKLASYAAYNEINNQLFVRNLQVYFARQSWPKDKQEAKAFRQLFTETLISFAGDLYLGAQKLARERGHHSIGEKDVFDFTQTFIPHIINEYEDAIFFPELDKKDQIVLNAYDMDAFRDSGLHWTYLSYAINSKNFPSYLEPDPFAAELITENIAQFGVLILRMTGNIGIKNGETRLKKERFYEALISLQDRINAHAKAVKSPKKPEKSQLASASQVTSLAFNESYFTDITGVSGIDSMHRSSDWLSRLLRSFLQKDKYRGTITIPPAFGGGGVASDDINNDGYPDILILSGLGNKLYINNRGKSFVDVTKAAGLDWIRPEDKHPGEPRQPLIADLNNDGFKDIIITYVNDVHRVYRNRGDGTFEDMTQKANLGGKDLVGGPAALIDMDNDGLLDIYITYFGNYLHGVLPTLKRRNDNGSANQLFKNMGNFTFKNVTEGSGVDDTGWAQAVTHTDLNRDGLQDLILGNDFGVNSYFLNLGNGKFRDIASELGTDKPSYTMSLGLSDLNNDLAPEIYVSNIVTMNKDEKYVLPSDNTTMKFNPDKLANMRVIEANDFFLSHVDANGTLSYSPSRLVGRGYSTTGWSWDSDFFDFDNDSDDDLYVVNGMNEFNLYSSENPYYADPDGLKNAQIYIPVSPKERNVFFVNEKGMLHNHSKQSGVNLLSNSRSAAYLDFDNDGDLDIILNNYDQKANFYRNNAQSLHNNWLKVILIGDASKGVNRDAVGAVIVVTLHSGKTIWRQISSVTGYMSVNPKEQYFGLGKEKNVSLEVIWPNGKRVAYKNVPINNRISIKYKE